MGQEVNAILQADGNRLDQGGGREESERRLHFLSPVKVESTRFANGLDMA